MTIRLERRLPITANLTEDTLMTAIDDVAAASLLAAQSLTLGIDRAATATNPANKSKKAKPVKGAK